MLGRSKGGLVARLFGASLIMQAMLSAANFLVGMILIRRTSDIQYGYFVLAGNALMLASGVQTALLQPRLVLDMTTFDQEGRSDLIGGLLRLRTHALPPLLLGGILLTLGLWLAKAVDTELMMIICVTLATLLGSLSRDFFRLILFAHHRPQDVLKADAVYVALLVTGVFCATLAPFPAFTAIAALGAAALVGRALLSRAVWRYEAWKIPGAPGMLGRIGSLGLWSTAGAAIHWALSQGYNYLVAGMLAVPAVASIAQTRLLMMPVNLISVGVGSMLFPMTCKWVHDLGLMPALRRLLLFTAVIVCAALAYFVFMWWFRGWIFTDLLRKHVPQRDSLLMLWCAVFTLMLIRDQLVNLLTALAQYRRLTMLTGVSAVISLAFSFFAMQRFGVSGAVAGVGVGELSNVIGIVVLIVLEVKKDNRGPPAADAQQPPPGEFQT
ncbi:MAG: capsular biosynthesis protein [Gammaproteobacteria bacterium]